MSHKDWCATKQGGMAYGPCDCGGSMKNTLGDAPIEPEYLREMNVIAKMLDDTFNGDKRGNDKEVGFVLLVFPYGEKKSRCNFISNGADRKDIVTLFKEMIARFEGQPEISGRG
jgi:hypothetical protein